MPTPSKLDDEYMALARQHINELTKHHAGELFDRQLWQSKHRVLEIGPSNPGSYHPSWWDTLDIVEGGTFQADITRSVPIAPSTYDYVLCLEVLEHVVDVSAAIETIRTVAKDGALCLFSAPWNFRLHHPTPDLWRFSVHGWKVLLRNFDDVIIDPLETPDRPLHPIHYNVSARVNKAKRVDPQDVQFEDVR